MRRTLSFWALITKEKYTLYMLALNTARSSKKKSAQKRERKSLKHKLISEKVIGTPLARLLGLI